MTDPRVLISLEAMAKMIKFDQEHPNKETAGLLIGKYNEDDNTLLIEDIEVGDQKGTAVHVEISEEALVDIVVRMSQREDGATIVGWWHTHPGLRSFMSSTDVSTQRNYQNLFEKAVAIVIDPLKFQQTHNLADLDFGVYRIQGNEYYKIPYEVIDAVPMALSLYLGSKPANVPMVRFNQKEVKKLKEKLENDESFLEEDERKAVLAWLEAVETIEEFPSDLNPINTINERLQRIENILNYNVAQKVNEEGKEAFIFSLGLMLVVSVLFFLFV